MSAYPRQLEKHYLYHFSGCLFCIKVRIVLWWMNIKLPLKDIMFHPSFRSELVSGGGKGQVPCLSIENEQGEIQWLYESTDIINYLKQFKS